MENTSPITHHKPAKLIADLNLETRLVRAMAAAGFEAAAEKVKLLPCRMGDSVSTVCIAITGVERDIAVRCAQWVDKALQAEGIKKVIEHRDVGHPPYHVGVPGVEIFSKGLRLNGERIYARVVLGVIFCGD